MSAPPPSYHASVTGPPASSLSYRPSMAGQLPGAAAQAPGSRLQLQIACKNLKKMDTFSKSDPYVVVHLKDEGSNAWIEVGRTETIKDNSHPDFAKVIEIDYLFEQRQPIRFDVYDHDKDGKQDSEQDFIGSAETTVGEVVGIHRGHFNADLEAKGKKGRGAITVNAEESSDAKGIFQFTARAAHVDKKDLFGKSDPYFIISRASGSGWTPVFKSEVVLKTLDPVWRANTARLVMLTNGNMERPLKIDVFDWNKSGAHDYIGSAQFNMLQILNQPVEVPLTLINDKKRRKKGSRYTNSGLFYLKGVVEPEYSFVDYLRGGAELSFTIAVDFTASNGDPATPQSLHYCNPHSYNAYQQAIMAVGSIIQDYDSDKLYPCFGFGAKAPDGRVLHEFSLNGSETNPFVPGIDGVLAAYQQALLNVQLWGPTNFAPTIRHAARIARENSQHYHVLLILTDGVITDFDATVREIITASSLPLSIIIIGVGQADFSSMEELDSDDKLLSQQHLQAERDIVQFVPFRQFSGANSHTLLAKVIMHQLLLEHICCPTIFVTICHRAGAFATLLLSRCSHDKTVLSTLFHCPALREPNMASPSSHPIHTRHL
eukprot:TRINITY_DN9027_c0_g1_i3.p1 TRINITY_DN9027_c0_g1~~TRINITY_DN9027_c0_g1_i3.p1  ORF type:complete len:601 (+),score=121.86 TRINITY_DN9027_c0_g1_i3:107-1909(+)